MGRPTWRKMGPSGTPCRWGVVHERVEAPGHDAVGGDLIADDDSRAGRCLYSVICNGFRAEARYRTLAQVAAGGIAGLRAEFVAKTTESGRRRRRKPGRPRSRRETRPGRCPRRQPEVRHRRQASWPAVLSGTPTPRRTWPRAGSSPSCRGRLGLAGALSTLNELATLEGGAGADKGRRGEVR